MEMEKIMFKYVLHIITAILLMLSFLKDRKRTITALKKSWKIFYNLLPRFLAILTIVGIILTLLKPDTISNLIGNSSGFIGMLISSLVGSFTLIPVFIAFPIASVLLENGAGIMQIAIFVSTLTTVGVATLPLEFKYFGVKASILRNVFTFIFSFLIAFIIGVILS